MTGAVTVILPVWPGFILSGASKATPGAVVYTRLISNGLCPLLVMLKTPVASVPAGTRPRACVSFSTEAAGASASSLSVRCEKSSSKVTTTGRRNDSSECSGSGTSVTVSVTMP